MKNKGFTLIELLAVIVILAIIALIATPIILNIIDDAKEESNERSVEMYAKAIENAVADYQLTNKETIADSFTSETINQKLKVEYDGAEVVCKTIEIYEDGQIYLEGCVIGKDNKEYSFGEKQICKISSDSAIKGTSIGAKYVCNLGKTDETKNLIFYVLQEPTSTTDIYLIMDRNYDNTAQPWCDQNGANPKDVSCEADGLFVKLNEIRGAWTKLSEEQITIPTADQLALADGKNASDYSNLNNTWLYSNFNKPTNGYWTSTSLYGTVLSMFYYGGFNYTSVSETTNVGIRPVIIIDSSELK